MDQYPDLSKAFLYFEKEFKTIMNAMPHVADQHKHIFELLEACKGPCLIRTTTLCQNVYTYYFFPTVVIQEIRIHKEPVFLIQKHSLTPETLKDIDLPAGMLSRDYFKKYSEVF